MSHSSGVIFDQIEAGGKRMTTAQEVEEHANRIAMLGMGQSVVLLRQYARLIKTHAEAVAALKSVAVDSQERFIRGVAKEALAQIEEGK
jgi:hypothetical protein